MDKKHHYSVEIKWTGNLGSGTSGYTEYKRDHILKISGKTSIDCSSDVAFRGDPGKHNPEELFLYSISSCHMLWYLHLCADSGIIVTDYVDLPKGIMVEFPEGGRFTEVILSPLVTINDKSRIEDAIALHQKAHEKCFIANSCNFPVLVHPIIQ